jgi:hypothetical protein
VPCGTAHGISRANWPIPADGTSHVSKTPKTVAKTATKTVAKTPAKTNSATGKIYIGVGGWTFAPWRGVFYPEKLAQAKELEYAASRLTSIEINGTYYLLNLCCYLALPSERQNQSYPLFSAVSLLL